MAKERYDATMPSEYDNLIAVEAAKRGINPDFARHLFWYESRFKADAKSPTGPVGLGQLTKATARAKGLRIDDTVDERLDPLKNISASLDAFKDELDAADGKYDVAALGYNQGRGPSGRPQIEAYKSGNYAGLSVEGAKYIKAMRQFSPDNLKSDAELAGITPESFGADFKSLTKGIEAKPSIAVGEGLVEAAGVNIEGQEPVAPNKSMGELYYETHGKTLDQKDDESTFSGFGDVAKAELHNSLLGQTTLAATKDTGSGFVGDLWSPTRWNTHQWSREELDQIRNAGVRPEYYSVITGGSQANLGELISQALENQKLDDKARSAGLGAQLTGGVVGAVVDPISWVPIAGQGTKAVGLGAKVLKAAKIGNQAGMWNVGSELVRTNIAGGDAHVLNAYAGGLLLGGGMTALSDALKVKHSDGVAGTTIRLENRIEAELNGTRDPTLRPIRDHESVIKSETTGVNYSDEGFTDGSVRLDSGIILSGSNPLNPKSQDLMASAKAIEEKYAPRARVGAMPIRPLTEIGHTIMRSKDDSVRSIGYDLVRAPAGLEDGASGKFGSTASDISEMLRYRDNQFDNDLTSAIDAMYKEQGYGRVFGRAPESHLQETYRSIIAAVEDVSGEKLKALHPSEAKVANMIKDHNSFKAEALMNPKMFGNDVSPSIMAGTHFDGHYFPVRYDDTAHSLWSRKLGGTEGLKEAIEESMMGSYHSDPHVKARVDQHVAEIGGTVEEYASKKAFGIANRGQDEAGSFGSGAGMEELNVTNLGDNSYLKARHLFGNDFEVNLPNGETFSINSLREVDIPRVLSSYNRRINGDIAIAGGTGKTTGDLMSSINKLPDGGDKAALTDMVKILTGRSRIEPEGAVGTLLRGLTDVTYAARNAYMAPQNYTEIAGMIARGGITNLGYAVPAMRKLMTSKNRIAKDEVDYIAASLFGRELDNSIMPKSQDIIDRLRAAGVGAPLAKVVGYTKAFTSTLAARTPMSQAMVGSTNHIIKAARIEAMTNALRMAHGSKVAKLGLTERLRHSASINKEQWEGILDLLRTHTVQDPKTREFSFKDVESLKRDPRSMDLWRLTDHVASETVMRADKMSNQTTKQFGAFAGLFLQFKTFTLRSINGRTMNMFHKATKDGRSVDTAMTTAINLGLQAAWIYGSTHLKAYSMSEKDRKKYLDIMLDPNMIAMGMLARSDITGSMYSAAGMVASPLGLDWFDFSQMYRTSILPKAPQEKKSRPVMGSWDSGNYVSQVAANVVEQTPSLSYAANVAATLQNVAGWSQATKRVDEREYMNALKRTYGSILPNDPITQGLLLGAMEEAGIAIK